MNKITTVGIDLAKRMFALHGVDGAGWMVLHKVCRRERRNAELTQSGSKMVTTQRLKL
jgi:hypothetical protein